jgi:hypothetical protein
MQNEERINGLETQVRTLKRIVYGFGCLFVAGLVVGATSLQTVPDVIQAKKFEVVNNEGKVVVAIKSHQEGGTISTHNSQGETLILMGVNNYGSGAIQTKNNKGHTLVALASNIDGIGTVVTENGKGEVTSITPARSDEVCCQHQHHLECIVNTTSASPGDCQHSHHLECGVTTIK